MRVVRWRNASTGVESFTITATGIYFPVGKVDSAFIARYAMASAGQTATIERVVSADGTRVGTPGITVSGTTEVVSNDRRGLSTGIIVTSISGTLIPVLDNLSPITTWPDGSLGRFTAMEDLVAYVHGSTPPVGTTATVGTVQYMWNGSAWESAGGGSLPIATKTTLGGVIVGPGAMVSPAGELQIRGGRESFSDVIYTGFDFSKTPNGPVPALDAFGNPIYVEVPVANVSSTPIIVNGAAQLTAYTAGVPNACYIGLQTDDVISEIGFESIGGLTIAIVPYLSGGIFQNWNWPLHLQIGADITTLEVFVSGSAVKLASATFPVTPSTPISGRVVFQNSTCFVWLNGVLVVSATDSRFTSMIRRYPIFEPMASASSSTRLVSGYVKTSKRTSLSASGVLPRLPFTTFLDTKTNSYVLTGSWQQIRGFQGCQGVNSAIVILKMRVNQTSDGPIKIDIKGTTLNSVQTSNIRTISNTIKNDIVVSVIDVKGIGGGFISVHVIGPYGTIPLQTGDDEASLTIIPTSYWG